MEKIDLMHSIYGKRENGVCCDCHFCHWKIAGKGESRYIASIWCEVYGINKQNIAETGNATQREIVKLLPYVITLVVLVITSIVDNKENQPPASLGQSYFREER